MFFLLDYNLHHRLRVHIYSTFLKQEKINFIDFLYTKKKEMNFKNSKKEVQIQAQLIDCEIIENTIH